MTMATIEENIEAALFGAVRDLETDPVLPVAWPNKVYEPEGAPYLRVAQFVNENIRVVLKGSGPHERRGILQLSVVTPLNGGQSPGTALAGAIAEQFPADRDLYSEDVKVRIQMAPTVMTPIKEDAAWVVPVSIRYEALA